MTTISIIIPLYNKGEYIERALKSVFSQTFEDYEIIVVDDGSTDNGIEIVKRFTDSRLRVIRQANAGPGAARNRGISECSSRYLAFLDADDEWMPRFLEKSINILRQNHDCDLTASSYYLGKEKTDISLMFRGRGIIAGPWQVRKTMSVGEIISTYYLFNSEAILCRREVIEKYGGFRTKKRCNYGEDTYLWLQVIFNHKIYRILEPLFWYHSEASELGPGRKTRQPLQTFLTEPEPIRQSCCPENREMLEEFLARFALMTAHECASGNGSLEDTRYLIKTFPLIKKFRWEYAKLKLKMAMPELVPTVRYMKKKFTNEHLSFDA